MVRDKLGETQMPMWAYLVAACGVVALLAVVLFVLLLVEVHKRRQQRPLLLAPQLENGAATDKIVAEMLDQVATWVPGQGYHGYWLNPEGNALQLKASISGGTDPAVAPDYSGLVIEDTPLVPLSLPAAEMPAAPEVVGARAERWLHLPFGDHFLVRVALGFRQNVPAALLARLAEAAELNRPLVIAVHAWLQARDAGHRARSLMDSTQVALDTTLRPDRGAELLLRVGAQVAEAEEYCALLAGSGKPLLLASSDNGRAMGERILNGDIPMLLTLPADPDVVPGKDLGRLGHQVNACIRVPVVLATEPVGCFFYFTERAARLSSYQTAVLRAMGERTAHLIARQRQMLSAAEGYLDTMRVLVEAMDGLSPHTVGHSDRLARYARLIAGQMGLPAAEAEAVSLAAYFHDVGMVAVDHRVVLKPGRLTGDEYEQVKAHAELGGQLLSSLPSSLPLGPIVASHHERWDGHGYPNRLKGEAIPLGARIISAADLFDAKTTSRAYRAPLVFRDALADLSAAAGSHLDPQVVEAFARAWDLQRRQAALGQPLERCWELKQLPAHICQGCPNRVDKVVRCWEAPDHLCNRHGDQCETCVVYTEVMSRSQPVGA